MEISTGVYVGQLSYRTREALWDRICKHIDSGNAVMVCSARNEQGFVYYTHNTAWQPVDFDGITLMRRAITHERKKEPLISQPPEEECHEQKMNEGNSPGTAGKSLAEAMSEKPVDGQVSHDDMNGNGTGSVGTGPSNATSADGGEAVKVSIPSPDNSFGKRAGGNRPKGNYWKRALPYLPWPDGKKMPADYSVLDMETTGLNPEEDSIIEIACVRVRNHVISDCMQCLIQYDLPLPEEVRNMTDISEQDLVQKGINLTEALSNLIRFLGGDCIIGHNVAFDIRFFQSACIRSGVQLQPISAIDTIDLCRKYLQGVVENFKLETLIRFFKFADKQAHRALPDAKLTALLFEKLNEIASPGE